MVGLRFSNASVDALCVSGQRLSRAAVRQRIPLRLRRAQQAQLQLETVGVEGGLADDFRQAALALAAHEVHLEKAETCVHVAGGGEQVVIGLGDGETLCASDIPAMRIVHQHSPSPLNPLGVKGVGEGGAVAPPAAVANAVCDALAPFGVEVNATPIRPEQLARALRRR